MKQSVQTIRRSSEPEQLLVLSISDLEAVPRPARIIPKQQLEKAFEEAVADLAAMLQAAGKQPSDDETTIPFHRSVRADEQFRSGEVDTCFLEHFSPDNVTQAA